MDKFNLSNRMKRYENISRIYLVRKIPVIIRIDGKSFHTFTKGFKKPFDYVVTGVMQNTMLELCKNIEGCVFGYTQSDEISLVLCDYKKLTSEAWFGNGLQKLCSVSASMATQLFNKYFREAVKDMPEVYQKRVDTANFDSRAFKIPKEEVVNYMIWRQNDAVRNSVEAAGHAYFSQKQLMNICCKDIIDKLKNEKSVIWEEYPIYLQRGSCCIQKPVVFNEGSSEEYIRRKWFIDYEIPIFTDNKDYIENCITFENR